jgi:glycosyltransferase involved in cell wall biosynthesis
LAHGTPAIASTGAPWSALETERCGWWVAPNRSSIENVLREALFLSRDQLAVMGARGQAYAAQKLNWASAAKQLVEQYRGLVERAA